MIGRFVLMLIVGVLLVSLLIALDLPRPVSAQDPLPTPAGQLGGRMPLPTAEGRLGGSPPQDTPAPSGHPLVGAWLLTFTEPNRAPAQVVFGDDDLVTFIDAIGSRGAGVWTRSGRQSGVVAVVVREAGEPGQPRQITMLEGSIEVGASGDAVTLVYTIETVDGSAATAQTAGPFTARGHRVDEQLIVPTSE
ncbi:MAG TPA: hypothetical protein VE420_13595 [Gemmatimonadales bacterium]|nr:hypothetical protein [Gemmatimonadales bacterium]